MIKITYSRKSHKKYTSVALILLYFHILMRPDADNPKKVINYIKFNRIISVTSIVIDIKF